MVGNVANRLRQSKASAPRQNLGRIGRLARRAAAIAGLAIVFQGSAAAAGVETHHPMRFDRISLDEGLSQSNVFAVMQDSRGLMWFGTENGLNRYNGYDFTIFKRERGNPDALLNDYIFDVAEDTAGRLWIATNGGGLALLDNNDVFTSYRHDPADDRSVSSIRKLLVDIDGSMWLGTRGEGVDRFNPELGMATNYRFGDVVDPSRNVNEVYALYRDGEGFLWVGTNDGLVRLDPASGTFDHYTHSEEDATSLSGHRVRAIFEDSQGELWVGTYGAGLNRFDRESSTFEHFRHDAGQPTSLSGDRVSAIYEDRAGRLWIGTDAGLNLYKRDGGTFVSVKNDSRDPLSLGGDDITTIAEDRSGILWVGTRNSGISKWNPRSWALGYDTAADLSASGTMPRIRTRSATTAS